MTDKIDSRQLESSESVNATCEPLCLRRIPVSRRAPVLAKELPATKAAPRIDAAERFVTNKILASIPDHEYRVIRPYLEYLSLPERHTFHEPGDTLGFAHFPNAGLISLLVATEDGKTVEAGIVGKEGVASIPVAVGLTRSPLREVALVSTDGFKVEANALLYILKSTPQLYLRLSRYAVVQGLQIAQTVACNRLHRIEQRLARWLLMAHDRVGLALIAMTHDSLAAMLGTNRPTVSSAAAILQERKSIEYGRGVVKISNRRKLEASACECYRVIRQFDRELELR
jgi:CRP-like cAMP-binding protein